MNIFAVFLVAHSALSGVASISGQVVDAAGRPVGGARVFLEEGLAAPLRVSETGPDGLYRFEDVPSGKMGVFAVAPGMAYGGATPAVAVEDESIVVDVRLGPPAALDGLVVDASGKPVSGAQVARVALIDAEKVAVPLDKLRAYGVEVPTTDSQGRFRVGNLPVGGKVAIKLIHPQFAQEGVAGISVGQSSVRITMEPGVVVRGRVLSRSSQTPVANVGIFIRSDAPPYDTISAVTNLRGEFMVRIKPGVYAYQADSAQLRSAGWEKLTVAGERPDQDVVLYVASTGYVRGEVQDAETREPVAGARLSLRVLGNPADVARTGPAGVYRLRATEGENIVQLVSAPGYQMPDKAFLKVHVPAGQEVELPVYWLVRNPAVHLLVLDESGEPVAGAAVNVARPQQFGPQRCDAAGRAKLEFAALPSDGVVVGWVEHPTTESAAAFVVPTRQEREAHVRLAPYASVSGLVVNSRGRPVEGVAVAGMLRDPVFSEQVVVWRTVSGPTGAFRWPWCPANVVVRCLATDGSGAHGESAEVRTASGADADAGKVVLDVVQKSSSMLGKPLKWYEHAVLAGAVPEPSGAKSQPAVVVYCSSQEGPIVISTLERIRRDWGMSSIRFVVVVETPFSLSDSPILVLSGKRPGSAATYGVGADGKVCFETFGTPPLAALRPLTAPAKEG